MCVKNTVSGNPAVVGPMGLMRSLAIRQEIKSGNPKGQADLARFRQSVMGQPMSLTPQPRSLFQRGS